MGTVDRMDQNISAYMIYIRNKKCWWPLFWFCIGLAVNNAYQLYHLQQPDQRALDLLGFRREIVQVYCSKYWNVEKILPDIDPAPRNHQKVIPDIHYNNESHWIIKGKQRHHLCQLFQNNHILLWKMWCWTSPRVFQRFSIYVTSIRLSFTS